MEEGLGLDRCGWMDGWMDGRMDGWTDGWMDVHIHECELMGVEGLRLQCPWMSLNSASVSLTKRFTLRTVFSNVL